MRELGLSLRYCLETHIHADRITGTGKLRELTGCLGIVPANAHADCANRYIQDEEDLELGSIAIAKRPQVLLCDEPTGALDFQTGKLVLQVLQRVNRELGTTIAVIIHSAGIAAMADRVITMRSGEIVAIEANETKISPEELDW